MSKAFNADAANAAGSEASSCTENSLKRSEYIKLSGKLLIKLFEKRQEFFLLLH